MNEAKVFESLMKSKDVQFEVDDRIEQAYRQGFEAGQAQYEEKHWNECRQISEYDAENKALKELLRKALKNIYRPRYCECESCKYHSVSNKGVAKCLCVEQHNKCVYKWQYHDDVEILTGGGENG